jgi:hypothetical protein
VAFDDWRGGYKNPSQEHYGSKKMRNWDYGIRNRDQDSQGVVGEVVFPNTVPPFYRKSIVTAHPPRPEDYQRCLAGIRAHNRWLKDFCAEDPVRGAGIGLILPNDLDEAIKDIEWRGCGVVSFCRLSRRTLTGSSPFIIRRGTRCSLPSRTMAWL